MFDYDFVPLPARPQLLWPDGCSVAVVVTVPSEAWDYQNKSSYPGGPPVLPMSLPGGAPDLANWTWREYGQRVGIWRIMRVLDAFQIRASVPVSGRLLETKPAIVEAMIERDWEFVPHGYIQGTILAQFADDPVGHAQYIDQTLEVFEKVLGYPGRGWLSSSMVFLPDTLSLLAERGLDWFGDFLNDDIPFMVRCGEKELVGLPYTIELNDYTISTRGNQTSQDFVDSYVEQFDVLREEARESGVGRVVSMGIHPHVTGQPFRIRALQRVLEHFKSHEDVWYPTRSELATYYRTMAASEASAQQASAG